MTYLFQTNIVLHRATTTTGSLVVQEGCLGHVVVIFMRRCAAVTFVWHCVAAASRGAAWPLSSRGIARQSSSRGIAWQSCLRHRVAVVFARCRVPIVFTQHGVAVGVVRHGRCLHAVLLGRCLRVALCGRCLHTALHGGRLCSITWRSSSCGIAWRPSLHGVVLRRLCVARQLSSCGCCLRIALGVVVGALSSSLWSSSLPEEQREGAPTFLRPANGAGGFLCSAHSCLNGRAMPLRDSGANRVRTQTGQGVSISWAKRGGTLPVSV
jgi:hypothetical protein